MLKGPPSDVRQQQSFLHACCRKISFSCLSLFSAPLVRQAKPGRSCGLGGVHHVNGLFDM